MEYDYLISTPLIGSTEETFSKWLGYTDVYVTDFGASHGMLWIKIKLLESDQIIFKYYG